MKAMEYKKPTLDVVIIEEDSSIMIPISFLPPEPGSAAPTAGSSLVN